MNVFRRQEPKRYRIVDPPLWEDIQGVDGDAITLLTYCWFGPQSTQYGILRVPDGYAMTDLGWDAARLPLWLAPSLLSRRRPPCGSRGRAR